MDFPKPYERFKGKSKQVDLLQLAPFCSVRLATPQKGARSNETFAERHQGVAMATLSS